MKDFSDTLGASIPSEEGQERQPDPKVSMGDLVGLNFTVWSSEVKMTKLGKESALMWVSPHSKDYLAYSEEGIPYYTRVICWGTHRIIQQLAPLKPEDFPFKATMVAYRDSSYQLAPALQEGETLDDIPF